MMSRLVLAAPNPLVVRPRAARRMLGNCSEESLWQLINSRQLESYLDGRARLITVASIEAYVQRKLASPGERIQTPRRRRRLRKRDLHRESAGV
jgi:hypothetical protein